MLRPFSMSGLFHIISFLSPFLNTEGGGAEYRPFACMDISGNEHREKSGAGDGDARTRHI